MLPATRAKIYLAIGSLLLLAGVAWYGVYAIKGQGHWAGSFVLCMLALPFLRLSGKY